MAERTLFTLQVGAGGPFDGSLSARALVVSPKVKQLKGTGAVRFTEGAYIEVPPPEKSAAFEEFSVTAELIAGSTDRRQSIVEGADPPVSLYLDKGGRVVGAIHTARGWQKVTSEKPVPADKRVSVVLTREGGELRLAVNGAEAGTRKASGQLASTGSAGLVVGTAIDLKSHQFQGQLIDLVIKDGVVSEKVRSARLQKSEALQATLKTTLGLQKVRIDPALESGYARLQPIKSIIRAVGVEKLTDLATLNVPTGTVITPGKIMVAPPKSSGPIIHIDWSKIAVELRAAKATEGRGLLAKYVPNRNSTVTIRKAIEAGSSKPTKPTTPTKPTKPTRPTKPTGPIKPGLPGGGLGPILRGRFPSLPVTPLGDPLGDTPGARPIDRVERALVSRRLADLTNLSSVIELKGEGLHIKDTELPGRLESATPQEWPLLDGPRMLISDSLVIPVDTSVMMADVLDLRGVELRVEPGVAKLYLIAEQIKVDAGTRITWREPGGSTPPRADNADLNGRGYSGQHLKPNSWDGLDGEDGRSGGSGLGGGAGRSAPALEIWARSMTGMPNLDLNGEDGIRGGRGQRGGRGGNGANGRVGKRVWVFGWHCTSDPGDGGDGGHGGDGGRGGRGGPGGDGGDITIGTLEDTLESVVTANTFRVKNEGGRAGRGGDGGPGGSGGRGGRSGVGETCKDADDGHAGSRGQPGRTGEDGTSRGGDGYLDFFEFDEDAWDELFTRPWVTEVSPEYLFPGGTVTLSGSRFTPTDRVHVGSHVLAPVVNADESISADLPDSIDGGEHDVFVRRPDGTESNRLRLWVKPQLSAFSAVLAPGATVGLTGRAFRNGASVVMDGEAVPTTFVSATAVSFEVPGTGGGGSTERSVQLRVRNPDGLVSNPRTATVPQILEIPFRFPEHALNFSNFAAGSPSWGTFEGTYGAAEVYHELLDPIFGHPVLTAAFHGFYHYFLLGEDNGGLATGFCTSLTTKVLDELWTGSTDTFTRVNLNAETRRDLTAIHGRLLSRESLIHFHDQGRQGVSRVEQTYREIESTFHDGCDRHNAPMLFFIPAGAVWDSGYFDGLGSSHCIAPIRFVYPPGHPGPSPDGLTDPDGVTLFCWDCNHSPTDDTAARESENCRLVFTRVDGVLHYEYFDGGSTPRFSSQDGITLGMMTNGAYLHSDHDLPFSGPFGVTRFVLDFLLSPADLQVTDEDGLRTGRFGSQILSEIPGSHPCYLMKGAYLLPADQALVRTITGLDSGQYAYHSVAPGGTSVSLEGVSTAAGQEDQLSMSADGSQIRIAPGAAKDFSLQIAREVGDELRAVSVQGVGGGPAEEVDITVSPDLSVLRVGNRAADRSVSVKAFAANKATMAHASANRGGVSLPQDHDLVVTVTDWADLDLDVGTLHF